MNQGPLDLQSNALPLSYTPTPFLRLDSALLGVKSTLHQRWRVRIWRKERKRKKGQAESRRPPDPGNHRKATRQRRGEGKPNSAARRCVLAGGTGSALQMWERMLQGKATGGGAGASRSVRRFSPGTDGYKGSLQIWRI